MKKLHHNFLMLAAALLNFACSPAEAAPKRVEAFDANVWRAMQADMSRPTVVLFSATWCPNCPAVMKQLAHEIKQRKLKAQLVAVVMDVSPSEADADLLANKHYQLADRLLAFSGQSAVIQYAVDPTWQGLTPYVVFLAPGTKSFSVIGPPPKAAFDRWQSGQEGGAYTGQGASKGID
ncbi:MAG: hypothetical protein IPO13_07635 [Rhodocyclaceae bacterium]|nr:hypothetical protein [Rhodocyclaceae bacterium]